MRDVHEIAKGMVQPWMICGCLAELFLGSIALPAIAFMFLKWWPVVFAIPLLIVASYLATAKDMYRVSVLFHSAARAISARSIRNWGGARTYVPR
ncbi:mating pair formation protein [Trinickia violacea]|uniref:Mating pair formation protein n=1 Tax=Trinickia violacea TaxID=2571746 RepID=A0A4P8J7J1_9BURK|nr:VirB3 family type IV secretion system protein [Trinickia violacea]QCP55119.1 mating pair formation protein [Trinickia violacea]